MCWLKSVCWWCFCRCGRACKCMLPGISFLFGCGGGARWTRKDLCSCSACRHARTRDNSSSQWKRSPRQVKVLSCPDWHHHRRGQPHDDHRAALHGACWHHPHRVGGEVKRTQVKANLSASLVFVQAWQWLFHCRQVRRQSCGVGAKPALGFLSYGVLIKSRNWGVVM